MTPEGKVKAAVKRWLKAKGVWYFMPVQTGMGVSGIPDLLCCWQGTFIAIETKAPGKRGNVTELQKYQMEGIRRAGGVAVVVDDASQLEAIWKDLN